jgi:glutamate synthase domain-containing protein 1
MRSGSGTRTMWVRLLPPYAAYEGAHVAPEVGAALMLHEMRGRAPDSAGFAVYSDAVEGRSKLTLLCEDRPIDWHTTAADLAAELRADVAVRVIRDHAVFETGGDARVARQWLIDNADGVDVLSHGRRIELFKSVGDLDLVAKNYDLASRTGTHAIAHTRMATESAITTNASQPFATGADTCLVHNGSLSNHNRLRSMLERQGESFQTDNDTEVAAGYMSWRLRHGDSIDEALRAGLIDLDGFYTFAIGVETGFAILRDPIACKPAIVAETDDWVAMSSEYRAIAQLPDVQHAEVFEPQPSHIYSWALDEPVLVGANS